MSLTVQFCCVIDKKRILHECSCFIEFIKIVGKKRQTVRLAMQAFYLFLATSLVNSTIIQEHEC